MKDILFNSAVWVALIALIPVFAASWFEKHSTNKAVLAEVYRLLKVVEQHRNFWQRCVDDHSTGRRTLIRFSYSIYSKQIKKIGVIRPRIVASVVEFYGDIDFVNSYQALKDDAQKTGHLDEFDKAYIQFLSRILDDFGPPFRREFERVGIGSKN